MEELNIEGLANHGDRERCVGAREGAGEASLAARAGQAIEPRNHRVRGADLRKRKANTASGVIASCRWARAVRDPVHVRNLHAREPGDPGLARLCDHRAGRSGKAKAARLTCTSPGSQTTS